MFKGRGGAHLRSPSVPNRMRRREASRHLLGRRAEETVLLSSTTGRPQERCACRKGRRGMEEAEMVVLAMATEVMAKVPPPVFYKTRKMQDTSDS